MGETGDRRKVKGGEERAQSTAVMAAPYYCVAALGAVLVSLWDVGVLADVYMHNPRGSNDRNCERNANRNNGNRLFDSQNNNAGGYGEKLLMNFNVRTSELSIQN